MTGRSVEKGSSLQSPARNELLCMLSTVILVQQGVPRSRLRRRQQPPLAAARPASSSSGRG